MSLDHPTFAPGGLAWALSEDAEKHLINGREREFENAINTMGQEMMHHGADYMDVSTWIDTIHENAQSPTVILEYKDGPDGPDPNDYIDLDGVYEASMFVTITVKEYHRLASNQRHQTS